MKKQNLVLVSILACVFMSCGVTKGTLSGSSSLEGKMQQGEELAKLGKASVHDGYIEILKSVNPNIARQLSNASGKKRLVDSLLEQELFYKESINRGINKLPKVKEKIALYNRVIVAQALLDEEVKKKATEYYEKNKEQEFTRIGLSHILIKPEVKPESKSDPKAQEAAEKAALEKAKAAKAKLDSGSSWEDAVKEFSDDRFSKDKQGEIGQMSRQDKRIARLGWEDLIAKAFGLKVGEISEPLKGNDGYHIIKITEAAAIAPYEEVQNIVEFRLRSQTKNELVSALTNGEKIQYSSEELKALDVPPDLNSIAGHNFGLEKSDAQPAQKDEKPAPQAPSAQTPPSPKTK